MRVAGDTVARAFGLRFVAGSDRSTTARANDKAGGFASMTFTARIVPC